jgi:DNA polymerase-3 subunit gamma/tau
MSYTVLARKYRPQTFADLAGQDHVTRTLANAIHSGRVAHAFLFTGVRGVGKTTSARLLAKALNCANGPTPEPCNACDACREITVGNDLDVLEMDGASNNSVDDVRKLQESIPYRPARDRFKIIIVDEVHMLSTGAFNAFLKTLEEPPPHVKFIFATTESHKVPVTIRSRCQRYDFRLIPQSVVAKRVREILAAETLTADDAAVQLVAREAAGSMRDALTLLDQIVAFGGEDLRGEEVARMLGLADRKLVHELAAAVLAGDAGRILRGIEQLASQGIDLLHFTRQILELARDLVVLRVEGDAEGEGLVDMVEEERAEAVALAQSEDLLELQRVFAGLAKLVDEIPRATAPRLVLEMGLVRLATRPKLLALGELVARLEAVEGRAGGARGATSPGPTRGPQPAQRPATTSAAPMGGRVAPLRPDPRDAAPPQRPAPAPTSGPQRPGGREAPRAPSSSSGATIFQPPPDLLDEEPPPDAPEPAPARPPVAPVSSRTPSRDAGRPVFAAPPHADDPDDAPASVPPPRAAGPAVLTAPPPPPPEAFERLVAHLRQARPALAAVLQHGVARTITADSLVLLFPTGSFFGQQANAPEALEGLAEAAMAVLGTRPKVEVTFARDATSAGTSVAQVEAARDVERREQTRQRALAHPHVTEALRVFPEAAGRVEVAVDVD